MKKVILPWVILVVAVLGTSCSSTSSGIRNGPPAATAGRSKFAASGWMKLDTKVKIGIMKNVIALAKKDNIIIRFSPEYYVKEVDSTIENAIKNRDEKGLSTSVGIMVHTIAAMDGDWDNGENKLEHAKKWLGPDYFEFFKQSFPQKYAALLRGRKEIEEAWKPLGDSGNHLISYDSQSINYASLTVAKIWTKTEPKNREAELEDFKKHGLYKAAYAQSHVDSIHNRLRSQHVCNPGSLQIQYGWGTHR